MNDNINDILKMVNNQQTNQKASEVPFEENPTNRVNIFANLKDKVYEPDAFEGLPAGEYYVKAVSLKIKNTSTGKPMAVIGYEVVSDNLAGRKDYETFWLSKENQDTKQIEINKGEIYKLMKRFEVIYKITEEQAKAIVDKRLEEFGTTQQEFFQENLSENMFVLSKTIRKYPDKNGIQRERRIFDVVKV